jgi:hypothetical protein
MDDGSEEGDYRRAALVGLRPDSEHGGATFSPAESGTYTAAAYSRIAISRVAEVPRLGFGRSL